MTTGTFCADGIVFVQDEVYVQSLSRPSFFPKRGRYIYAKERLGTEFRSSRTSFFYNPETKKECEGIASVVWQSQIKSVVENLPDIRNIDLRNFNPKSRSRESKQIRQYMKDSHIRNIETLKKVHQRALHLYGDILWDESRKATGVIVIDSVQSASPFSKDVLVRLEFYAKLFTSAI